MVTKQEIKYIVNGRKSKYNNLEEIIKDIDSGKIPIVKDKYLNGADDVIIMENINVYDNGKLISENNSYYYITPKGDLLSDENILLIKNKLISLLKNNCAFNSIYLNREQINEIEDYIKTHYNEILDDVVDFYYITTDYKPCNNISFKTNINGVSRSISIRENDIIIDGRVYGRNVHHRRTIKLNDYQIGQYLKKYDFLLNK